MIYEKQSRDTSEETNELKDLEELLKNLPQILQELEEETVPKENTENRR